LSTNLHEHVELAFEEHEAQRWICDLLQAHGLDVERGLGTFPTAFRARAGTRPGPTVGFLLEYDGLPVYGHTCGHNMVAAAGAGAAAAIAPLMSTIDGSVVAVGTPGEEAGGAKEGLAAQGHFDDLDVAM